MPERRTDLNIDTNVPEVPLFLGALRIPREWLPLSPSESPRNHPGAHATRITGQRLRPFDVVCLVLRGRRCRGTVVEVRGEQVRVAVGGAVPRVPSEDVLAIIHRVG